MHLQLKYIIDEIDLFAIHLALQPFNKHVHRMQMGHSTKLKHVKLIMRVAIVGYVLSFRIQESYAQVIS